eukprot:scaffold37718_cov187-Skeletonema_marinoi.AAC.12
MPQPLFIHSTRSMTYSPESSKDRISERDSSDDECDGMSFAQLPSSRLKSIQHSGAESQKSCIATLDQLLEMDERDKEKTAAWEAATLNANSAETDQAGSSAFSRESKENEASEWMRQRNATRRFGDDRTNIQPFASTQARSGIGQSKPNTASSKRVQLKGSIAAHDEPSVGTAELRAKAKAEPSSEAFARAPSAKVSANSLTNPRTRRASQLGSSKPKSIKHVRFSSPTNKPHPPLEDMITEYRERFDEIYDDCNIDSVDWCRDIAKSHDVSPLEFLDCLNLHADRDEEIRSIEKHGLLEPEPSRIKTSSWRQPDADFPGSNADEVNDFLRGEEECRVFHKFNDLSHAQNWANKYFDGGHGQGSGNSAIAVAGPGVSVTVTKKSSALATKAKRASKTKKRRINPMNEAIASASSHFRGGGDNTDKGIDLRVREQFNHYQLNQFRHEEDEPDIKNSVVKQLFVALKKFMSTMKRRNYKDLKGKPVLYNTMSLPLGLPEDAILVALLWNYLTLEDALRLLPFLKNGYTAERSDNTLFCNTLELARLAVHDRCLFGSFLGDMNPVAYPHGSTLEKHVGEKIARKIMQEYLPVLSILVNNKNVKIGLGSGTANQAFSELFGVKKYEELKDSGRLISAGVVGAEYQTAYHPCCYYSTKCLFGDMSIRLERGTNFFSNVRWVIDPTLPRATIFDDFFEEHSDSDIVLFIHQAYLESCSRGGLKLWSLIQAALNRRDNGQTLLEGDKERIEHWENFEANRTSESCSLGGTNNWKLTQAALNRRDNEQTLLEGDKERIEWYSAWLKAGSLHNKKLSEAAKRRRESRAQLPGDREMLEKIDKAAKAGGQATREKKDEEAGRTSNTMFVCIRCAERDKVTYRMLPKSENTHSQRLLKGLPLVDYKQGTAKCEECRIRNPDESNQHALWAAVEKDEEETVKARMFPKRIRTTIISRMCEREGCSSVQYTSSRGKTYSHCQKHQYPGKRKS